jgi:hypothetical protein
MTHSCESSGGTDERLLRSRLPKFVHPEDREEIADFLAGGSEGIGRRKGNCTPTAGSCPSTSERDMEYGIIEKTTARTAANVVVVARRATSRHKSSFGTLTLDNGT